MTLVLGIGIATFNRHSVLQHTIDCVRRYTSTPFHLVVGDDGSSDQTVSTLIEDNVITVAGANRGIAWNKNRSLFTLLHFLKCDVIILIEDDVAPRSHGWELDWVSAACNWGHVNLAGAWFERSFLRGRGSPIDPIYSSDVTGQCSAFTRNALLFGGLLDTRFKGFGFEHVEHTIRLIRSGYGGIVDATYQPAKTLFALIHSDLALADVKSHSDPANIEINRQLAKSLLGDHRYRSGAADIGELTVLREEVLSALSRRKVVS